MTSKRELEQSLRRLHFTTDPAADQRILRDALAALEQQPKRLVERQTSLWRIIMNKHWTKLATSAAVVAVAIVSFAVFNRSATPAYAIEQTLEANRSLRSVHIQIEPRDGGLSEAWALFDDEGNPLHLRMEFPQTKDGPKTTVWQADRAEVWFHAKKSRLIVNEPNILGRFPEMLQVFDPRPMVEHLLAAQAAGEVSVEIQPPAKAGDPIIISSTSGPNAEYKDLFAVDPLTKFVLRKEKQRLVDGEYTVQSSILYSDYNQEPDPSLFVLQTPEDVVVVDQTSREIGLPKGDLSDNEIAVKVAREFFDALVADDYAKAGQITGGLPADKLREYLAGNKYVRLISVGPPFPHADRRTEFTCVPCEVEVQTDGKTEVKTITLNIRHAYNQPDRWVVGGGI